MDARRTHIAEELHLDSQLDALCKNVPMYVALPGMDGATLHGIKVDEVHLAPGCRYDVLRDTVVGMCYEHGGGVDASALSMRMRCDTCACPSKSFMCVGCCFQRQALLAECMDGCCRNPSSLEVVKDAEQRGLCHFASQASLIVVAPIRDRHYHVHVLLALPSCSAGGNAFMQRFLLAGLLSRW